MLIWDDICVHHAIIQIKHTSYWVIETVSEGNSTFLLLRVLHVSAVMNRDYSYWFLLRGCEVIVPGLHFSLLSAGDGDLSSNPSSHSLPCRSQWLCSGLSVRAPGFRQRDRYWVVLPSLAWLGLAEQREGRPQRMYVLYACSPKMNYSFQHFRHRRL